MKLIKYCSGLMIAGVLLGSCSIKEELVDVPTPSAIKTENDATAVINGMYTQLNDAAGFKFQGMMPLFLGADDIFAQATGELLPWTQRTITSTQTQGFWNTLYRTIANANDLISQMDRLKLDAKFEQRAVGEAYFLRGFCYYNLVRLFGGVPLRTEKVDINSDFYLPRSTMEQTYDLILSDFLKASTMLPLASAVPATELGRASKGAAQAYYAEANLTLGDMLKFKGQTGAAQFQKASDFADSVINSNEYVLINNFKDVFDITKENSAFAEVIFAVRFMTDNQARAQPAAGSEFALRFGASNTHFVCGNTPNGQGDNSMRVNPWFADFYRTGDYAVTVSGVTTIDYRNEVSFMQSGVNSVQAKTYYIYPNVGKVNADGTINIPMVGKYIDPNGKDSRNNGNDFFAMRFSDVYLIKAEAQNELNGPNTAGVNAFNQLRNRARKADGITARTVPANVTVAALTKNSFRQKIFEERGLEFLGEGKRRFELLRFPSPLDPTKTMMEYQFQTYLPTLPTTMPTYVQASKTWNNKGGVWAASLPMTFPKWLLYPIPSSEILQNPKFGDQNPGW